MYTNNYTNSQLRLFVVKKNYKSDDRFMFTDMEVLHLTGENNRRDYMAGNILEIWEKTN